jgi:hypothetical protein
MRENRKLFRKWTWIIICLFISSPSKIGQRTKCIYTPPPPPPPPPGGGGGYTVLPLSVQDIFHRIFLSNYQWQKSDIWSQASYRYAILWVAFLEPSDSYFLFADLVDFYTHWTYTLYAHFWSHFSQQLLMAQIWYLVTSFI